MTTETLGDNLGLVSYHDFVEACQNIVERAESIQKYDLDWYLRVPDRYLRVSRQLGPLRSEPDVLEDLLDELSDVEDVDDLAIYREQQGHPSPSVEYHIIHSTSYQVPVLYFFVHDLPCQSPKDIDTIYEYLVPKQHREALRGLGILGGIGMILIKGTKRKISAQEYLIMWIGLVCGAVGLNVPKEMAMSNGG
ncbi:MAG: hypothetical protein Q9217_004040 [Psora testacea]